MGEWFHLFVGREAELEALRRAYAEASGGCPRVVAIVAESGFGKTRLVQEFYNWLSTHHDGVDAEGYWPDRLLKREDNLMVNPDVGEAGVNGVAMPFLWWGLRLHDPNARNEIVSRALWSGLDILKAHLERYSIAIRAETLRHRTDDALRKGALDLAVDAVGNLASFGLLGAAKTLLEGGKELYDLDRERRLIDRLDASPAAADRRANDELTQLILADLARLAKSPPQGLVSIPLVIVLDDAQWLSHDEGTTAFAEALVSRARLENWPLLVILTSWEREWRDSERLGGTPASLLSVEHNDCVLYLDRTPELIEVVKAAFPGLTDSQRTIILGQVDGNPRFLDEVLMYLARNPKYFEGRDMASPLTDRGVDEVTKREFPDFVAERFADAPDHVRRAMSLASLHGTTFSTRIVKFMAAALHFDGAADGLAESENPHGFASFEKTHGEGEFRLRAYRNAAWDDLGNHVDEEAAQRALKSACALVVSDISSAGERDLLLVLEGKEWESSIAAGAELINRANGRHDLRAAGAVAKSVLPFVLDHASQAESNQLAAILDAYSVWEGKTRQLVAPLALLADRARQEASLDPTAQRLVSLASALRRLGNTVETLDGPNVSRPVREEETAIRRAVVEAQPTPEARRDLASALSSLGGTVSDLDGPSAARPILEEAVATFRTIADAQSTPSVRRGLAIALIRLGDAIESLHGPASALTLREEAAVISRTLVGEWPTHRARRDLSMALNALSRTVKALDGPAAVRPLHEEQAAILRSLAEAQPTPEARRDLAIALGHLGNTVEALDGPAAARPVREEETAILRALAEAHPTAVSDDDLACSLGRLGDTVEALDGPAAARPLREAAAAILRALVEAQPTHDSRRALAITLGPLGNTVEALEGPTAARPLREEATAILRALAEPLPTSRARVDLAVALTHLGDTVEALDGPAAVLPLREEAAAILRALVEAQPTLDSRRALAIALGRLGDTVGALDGCAAARPLREEATAILRALAEALPTPGARNDLAAALTYLGDTVEALDGPAAVRPLREEAAVILRALVEAQSTPGSRRALAIALGRLGDTVEALDGCAAARPLREEADQLGDH